MQKSRLTRADAPEISVVMPVHNALPYLDSAIESILAQSFRDFELVILDDASSDGSTERLREWAARDPRIRLLEEERQLGPALSSQRVAEAARAPLVARMDADDISYPERLREQANVLARHPEAGVVGSLCDTIDTKGRKLRGPEVWRLARRSWFVPFAHGSMMYRRSVFDAVGGYREACVFWEDQDLIPRMAIASRALVIPHSLYQVRQSASSTRFTSEKLQLERSLDLMYRCLERLERDEGYDDLLEPGAAPREKVDPRVYISLGTVILWAGKRPRLLRRFLGHARIAPDFRSVSAFVWTAWASISPGSLRAFLLMLLSLRNRLASTSPVPDGPVPWPQQAPAVSSPVAADKAPAQGARKA